MATDSNPPTPKPATAPVSNDPPPDTESITLVVPITIGGSQVNKLQIRRPKVADRLVLDKQTDISAVQREALMFGNLTGLAPEEVALLDLADYGQLQEKYEFFTGARPKKP